MYLYDILHSLLKSKRGGLKGFVYVGLKLLFWRGVSGTGSETVLLRSPPVNVPCMTGVGLVLFDSSSRIVPSALYIPSDRAVSLMDLWCFLIVLNMIVGGESLVQCRTNCKSVMKLSRMLPRIDIMEV